MGGMGWRWLWDKGRQQVIRSERSPEGAPEGKEPSKACLGPGGMSRVPTSTRLGLLGFSTSYRVPLETFEQETDSI